MPAGDVLHETRVPHGRPLKSFYRTFGKPWDHEDLKTPVVCQTRQL